ncbi:HD-GYP domain-containing protein [Ferrimonas balearica]|uniref:HD-GYP domain-containing protein n=1 Tax=Ferrimonas balearica TaxID=44012 RepID=UPI001C9A1A32|nr:HD domain-containing phosphohydrolase [Ferrimonas balearica]MBY5920903.1 response regulator [Ferrimonas balearica]MBY5996412.1 response regulator [Ferrimonas balearica]
MNLMVQEQATVLIVDDSPENLQLLAGILSPHFRVLIARNGREALSRLPHRPDLILMDIVMPDLDGYALCQQIKADADYCDIPVIFISVNGRPEDEVRGFECGAIDYIRKPFYGPAVMHRVRAQLAAQHRKLGLLQALKHEASQLQRSRLVMIEKLAKATAFKDEETGLHVLRVAHYAQLIAESYGCSAQWSKDLFHAAPLHDIGKIGIPDAILSKPGKLDAAEWEVMKTHTELGAQLLEGDDSDVMTLARAIARHHHERFDGAGYPSGLEGQAIPLEARIVAIADVFDALISTRPYKPSMPYDQAFGIIGDSAGTHLDPELVGHFLRQRAAMIAISQNYRD